MEQETFLLDCSFVGEPLLLAASLRHDSKQARRSWSEAGTFCEREHKRVEIWLRDGGGGGSGFVCKVWENRTAAGAEGKRALFFVGLNVTLLRVNTLVLV